MCSTEDMAQTGVALIGAGMIAKTHVAAISASRPHLRLDAIVSRHPQRAQYLNEYYAGPAPLYTSTLSDVTDNPDIQVVIVATPPSVRIDLIQTLARAGKQVLLEKPVARNLDEATQVVKICERAGVTLGVLFQHRMRAPSLAAARRLAEGSLGKPAHVEIAAPLWRPQSYYDELGRGSYERDGGGVLLTQAIHTIDLALSLTGPVSRVQAMTATTALHQMEAEDLAVAGLHFSSGAVGSLIASTATFPHGRETITLHCENGSMRVGPDALDIFWHDGRCEREADTPGQSLQQGAVLVKYEWHQGIIDDFVNSIEQGRQPLVSGRAALEPHRLIAAIESSSHSGAAVELDIQAPQPAADSHRSQPD